MTSAEAKEIAKLRAIIAAWYQAGDVDTTRRDAAHDFRTLFPRIGSGDPSREIGSWLRHGDKRAWHAVRGYFSAVPVTTVGRDGEPDQSLWPLVNFHLRQNSGRVQMMIRVVLCAEDVAGQVDGWGWRFDSADADDGDDSHPYAHLQHITTWEAGSQGFRWPELGVLDEAEIGQPVEYRKTIPETKPAVPLACTDAGGLAVAAMISLYGMKRTAEMLRGVTQGDDAFRNLSGRQKLEVLEGAV